MPGLPDGRIPSREEFLQTIETEFDFLTSEDGYTRNVTGEFTVEFVKGANRLALMGAGYGFQLDVILFVDEQHFPYWNLAAEFRKQHKAAKTDAPQLDAIREYAWWFKNEFRGILKGDPEALEKARAIQVEVLRQEAVKKQARLDDKKGMFFSAADKLFKAQKYAECVKHLELGEFPLSGSWKERLEYAKKHS